jgi:hypothetical protein
MKKMKKRVIKLKESDLERLVNKILKEDMGGMDDYHPTFGTVNFSKMSDEDFKDYLNFVRFEKNKKSDYKTDDGDFEHGSFDEVELDESEKWIQKAIEKPGSLRKKLGVSKDEKITSSDMEDKLKELRKKDKEPKEKGIQGLSDKDLSTYRQILLAKKLKKFKS